MDIVAGPPEFHYLVRPYSVVTDSHGRLIVTDPGAMGVHIFDVAQQKYKFISRPDAKDALRSPQCVAVDKQDNIYVTDSNAGKIFVFDANGKFRHVIGSLKGGEGFFKRPTGIAVDSDAQRIYVTDTLARQDLRPGHARQRACNTIGKSGTGDGEFNFPTELRLDGQNLIVVDAMNFRVQVLAHPAYFSTPSDTKETAAAISSGLRESASIPRATFMWSMALYNLVQVFNREGVLLYYFGRRGRALETSSCRQDCLSIITTASMWWTPITVGFRYSTTLD